MADYHDLAAKVRRLTTSALLRMSRDRLALLDCMIEGSDEMGYGELAPLERAAAKAIDDEIDRRIPIPGGP